MPNHRPPEDKTLFETILGSPPERVRVAAAPWHASALAWTFAVGAHLVLIFAASRAEPSLETWSARMATLIHEQLSADAPVFIEEAPTPTPEPSAPPVIETAPPQDVLPRPMAEMKSAVAEVAPPPEPDQTESVAPAASGEIIAAEPALEGPVDFMEEAFVTGLATAYAGGASSAEGASEVPVSRNEAKEGAKKKTPVLRESKARPVGLASGAWRCRWPQPAVAQDIYEYFVELRVLVQEDGRAQEVTVMDRHEYGFAEAARACALRTRFLPAYDDNGDAIKKMSPPIRVRFTR